MNNPTNYLLATVGFSQQVARIFTLLVLLLASFITPVYATDGHEDGHDDGHGDEHEDAILGPHGGRLLTQGDISVELLLSGHSDGPGYQAWITRHGQAIDDRNAVLGAEFVRLDGETLNLDFEAEGASWHGTQPVEEPHSFDVTVRLLIANENYEWTFGSYEGRVEIAPATAIEAGVKSEIAGAGPINQTLTLYGKTIVDPTQLSHLRARFPGTITRLHANIGDQVKAGQVLGEVESNQNLRAYELYSPMSGVVIARDGNPGELAQSQNLLTIANYDILWVDLQVFPSQARKVKVGQAVRVFGEHQEATSSIRFILPGVGEQPFLRARVLLDNTKGQWAPGLMLSGSVAVLQTEVPLRVKSRAIQQMDGQDVVFIQSGDAFEARPVVVGTTDGVYTEILGGISPGTRYVAENSFLIKADLGKSGAAHNH